MGETVEARYKNGSQYYKGNIVSVNSNGTYDIRYDDGDEERNVSAYKIRRKAGAAASTKLREGDAVEAQAPDTERIRNSEHDGLYNQLGRRRGVVPQRPRGRGARRRGDARDACCHR